MALSPAEETDERRKRLIKRFKLIIVCGLLKGMKARGVGGQLNGGDQRPKAFYRARCRRTLSAPL